MSALMKQITLVKSNVGVYLWWEYNIRAFFMLDYLSRCRYSKHQTPNVYTFRQTANRHVYFFFSLSPFLTNLFRSLSSLSEWRTSSPSPCPPPCCCSPWCPPRSSPSAWATSSTSPTAPPRGPTRGSRRDWCSARISCSLRWDRHCYVVRSSFNDSVTV